MPIRKAHQTGPDVVQPGGTLVRENARYRPYCMAMVLMVIMSLWGNAVSGRPRPSERQPAHKKTADDEKLSIKILQLAPQARLFGGLWVIYLDGIIDKDAPNRLENEINARDIQHAMVYLNSPGGNLVAGMRLGRLFRKLGFSTHVERWDGKALTNEAWIQRTKEAPGECYSACVFAFVAWVLQVFR